MSRGPGVRAATLGQPREGLAQRVIAWLYRAGRAPLPIEQLPVGLYDQFRRNALLYVIGGVMLAVQQALMAERDFLVKAAVDGIGSSQTERAAWLAGLILLVSVCAAVARLASRATVFTGGRNVEYELRAALLHRLHRLGPTFFGKVPTGEVMSRATNDLFQVRLLLGFGILNIISSAFALVSAIYVMVSISWRLTLAALAMWPVLAVITRSFSTGMFVRSRENQEALGEMSDRVLASLAGVRVVRSFAMEESVGRDFDRFNRRYLDKSLRLAKLRGSMGPVIGAVGALGVLIVFWYGGALLLSPDPATRITTGDFVAFWLALLRLTWPMLAVGFVAGIIQRGRAGYERLRTVFDAEPDVTDGPRQAPEQIRGELVVEGLSFAYGDEPVLEEVSFEVPAGGSLAIVGRTASGKSTLAALLPRLLPAPPGTVFLDGVDVSQLPLEAVRAAIAYAQQDAFLFSTTVADNIAYGLRGDVPATAERRQKVRQAAAEAQVLSDIELLPEKFDTVVGERGVQLSGGQKQRVALARALIGEPPVLLLDDPLSAVDAKTEAAILEAIERQAAQRTVLLVTHRVAAAQRCDQILVLDRGRVVEGGTHDELLEAGGLYALFAEEQRMEEDLASLGAGAASARRGLEAGP
ncbi:MAG: ABC transporter ATP-binding protein [Deltaproteobacteria bacterium]|jgi:ATP-binding cassette subfamily B protein|nr:ABC transporter ATP-binding protein [Deltaproteobacteria bacterium]MBW2535375.1 ABC transporter ATP-binding protein [Deltaproteobacteria bacterium]